MSATVAEQPLTERHRPVHRALVDAVLAPGTVPAVPELADRLGTSPEEVRESLRTPRRSSATCSPMPSPPGVPAAGTGERTEMPETHAEAVLYTQAGCAESAQVRTWLTDQGIPFVERNASADPEAAAALAATGTFATPLVVVGEETVLGFRPAALAAALRLPGRDAP